MGRIHLSIISLIIALLVPQIGWAVKSNNIKCVSSIGSLEKAIADFGVQDNFPEDLHKYLVNTTWSPEGGGSNPPFSIVQHRGRMRMLVNILGNIDFNPVTMCVTRKGSLTVSTVIYGQKRNLSVRFAKDPNYLTLSSPAFGQSTYRLYAGKTKAAKRKVLQQALASAQ